MSQVIKSSSKTQEKHKIFKKMFLIMILGDKMVEIISRYFSKAVCALSGHDTLTETCPFTKATLVSCKRCGRGSHKHSEMSFS